MTAGGKVFFPSASSLIALSLNQPPVSQANFRALALHQRFTRLAQKSGFSIFPLPHRHNTAVSSEIKAFFHNRHLIRTVISVDKIQIEQDHPTTVFCKISVRRSRYCLHFSIDRSIHVQFSKLI